MDIKRKITGIQHVGIPTNDMQKSIRFYKELGFEVVWQTINEQNGESVVFLQLGNLIMEIYEKPTGCNENRGDRSHRFGRDGH